MATSQFPALVLQSLRSRALSPGVHKFLREKGIFIPFIFYAMQHPRMGGRCEHPETENRLFTRSRVWALWGRCSTLIPNCLNPSLQQTGAWWVS